MLRNYQKTLLRRLENAIKVDRTVVLQAPTGAGKTHIAAKLIAKFESTGQHVWFLCHRRELVGQAQSSLRDFGIDAGVIAGGFASDLKRSVQICSIPSLRYRAKLLRRPDLIVWDECHHVAASSWSSLIGHFADIPHLGLTATPNRLDGVALGQWFRGFVKGPSTRSLIEDGTLSDYRLYAPTAPDLRGVQLANYDYNKAALAKAMERPQITGNAVEHYLRIARRRSRALAFCVSIDASRSLVARMRENGVEAEHIDGDTPLDERDRIVRAFAAGAIKVLSNVEVFTEGFDVPALDAIILLRPTKSLGLYHQMVGRGLRAAAGKSKTIILDHSGLCYDHGLPDADVDWSLNGRPFTQEIDRSPLRHCPECSCVHQTALECPECGHIYETGDRTIDEVFGKLREVVRIVAKNGSEHPTVFAARIGVNPSTVWSLIRRGLPRDSAGGIPVQEALHWLCTNPVRQSNNVAPFGSLPSEYESQRVFGLRFGLSSRAVQRLTKKGLPHHLNGWIRVQSGLNWMRDRAEFAKSKKSRKKASVPLSQKQRAVLASLEEFKRRSGVRTTFKRFKLAGIPLTTDGRVDISAALEWIKAARIGRRQGSFLPGFETRAAFARRIGVGKAGAMRTLRRRGLPFEANGLINIESGLAWFQQYLAAS